MNNKDPDTLLIESIQCATKWQYALSIALNALAKISSCSVGDLTDQEMAQLAIDHIYLVTTEINKKDETSS